MATWDRFPSNCSRWVVLFLLPECCHYTCASTHLALTTEFQSWWDETWIISFRKRVFLSWSKKSDLLAIGDLVFGKLLKDLLGKCIIELWVPGIWVNKVQMIKCSKADGGKRVCFLSCSCLQCLQNWVILYIIGCWFHVLQYFFLVWGLGLARVGQVS